MISSARCRIEISCGFPMFRIAPSAVRSRPDGEDRLDGVADVAERTGLAAVAVDRDRPALEGRRGDLGDRPAIVGAHARPVRVEQADDVGAHAMDLAERGDEGLAESLGLVVLGRGPTGSDVAPVGLGLRMDERVAIDLGRRGVGQGRTDRSCDLEQPPRPDRVGREGLERQAIVVDRAGRRRQVQDDLDVEHRRLLDVRLDQRESGVVDQLVEIRTVARREVVDADDLVVASAQLTNEVAADESGATRDQDPHASDRRRVGVRATRPTPM